MDEFLTNESLLEDEAALTKTGWSEEEDEEEKKGNTEEDEEEKFDEDIADLDMTHDDEIEKY